MAAPHAKQYNVYAKLAPYRLKAAERGRDEVEMDEFSGGRSLIYKSDNIYERRRRILSEARKMIAEGGLAGFSVRELCNRAGIAQKTLYNAFGSKENVIALAIRQYMTDFNERAKLRFDTSTLDGRLERLIKVHSRNLQIRPYTTAIMAVYNSPTADSAIREAIRSVSEAGAQPFADAIDQSKALLPGVTAKSFVYFHTTTVYAVLTDWCLGDFPDDELVERVCECFLMTVVASTRGQPNSDARRWLQDLRGKRPSWLAMQRLAEVGSITNLEPGTYNDQSEAPAVAEEPAQRPKKRPAARPASAKKARAPRRRAAS